MIMKKTMQFLLGLLIIMSLTGCAGAADSKNSSDSASPMSEAAEYTSEERTTDDRAEADAPDESTADDRAEADAPDKSTADDKAEADTSDERITDDQAVDAITDYCYAQNPDLKDIADAGEYPVYWEISSSDDKEIVVVFRSYTGSLTFYHIDPATGDTYVTEIVPGIIDEEERTDETLNVRDYIK